LIESDAYLSQPRLLQTATAATPWCYHIRYPQFTAALPYPAIEGLCHEVGPALAPGVDKTKVILRLRGAEVRTSKAMAQSLRVAPPAPTATPLELEGYIATVVIPLSSYNLRSTLRWSR
jgi:hypothetical protein